MPGDLDRTGVCQAHLPLCDPQSYAVRIDANLGAQNRDTVVDLLVCSVNKEPETLSNSTELSVTAGLFLAAFETG